MNGIWILLLLIISAALPAFIVFIWFKAIKSPVTLPLFLASLAAGVVSLLAAVLVQRFFPPPGKDMLGAIFFGVFIRIALVEEASRLVGLIPLLKLINRRRDLNKSFCAAIGFASGLGFGMMESAFYGVSGVNIILLRALTAAPLHGACGIRAGVAIFTVRKHPVQALFLFISAVLLHGAYNLIIVSPAFPPLLAAFIALAALFTSIHYLTKAPGMDDENTSTSAP